MKNTTHLCSFRIANESFLEIVCLGDVVEYCLFLACWSTCQVIQLAKKKFQTVKIFNFLNDYKKNSRKILVHLRKNYILTQWVDSLKRRNDVGNLTLLSNLRFSTSFRRLEESPQ